MQILYPDTPRAKLFPRGMILWRSADIDRQGNIDIRDIEFPKTPQGSYICRCGVTGNWLHESEIYQSDEQVKGFVVFLKELPSPNWTHLIVTGCSKRMFEDPRTNPLGSGCAIFADPGKEYDMSNYLKFRLDMYQAMRDNPDADSWESRFDLSSETWPDDFRVGDKRLIYYPYGESEGEDWYPAFDHQVIQDPASVKPKELIEA